MRDPQEPGYPEVLAALRADDLIQIDQTKSKSGRSDG